MYRLGVKRSFSARHHLIGGDFGPENDWHCHHYDLEIRVSGQELGPHGFLIDITELESALDAVVARYAGAALNERPEFEGLNPSLEHFARLISDQVEESLQADTVAVLAVRLWENPESWAEYSRTLQNQGQS